MHDVTVISIDSDNLSSIGYQMIIIICGNPNIIEIYYKRNYNQILLIDTTSPQPQKGSTEIDNRYRRPSPMSTCSIDLYVITYTPTSMHGIPMGSHRCLKALAPTTGVHTASYSTLCTSLSGYLFTHRSYCATVIPH